MAALDALVLAEALGFRVEEFGVVGVLAGWKLEELEFEVAVLQLLLLLLLEELKLLGLAF